MATALERDDIIVGLRELVDELRDAGEVAGIRLVRPGSDAAVAAAAAKVAQRHDWDASWLNFEVTRADALPTLGRAVEFGLRSQAGSSQRATSNRQAP